MSSTLNPENGSADVNASLALITEGIAHDVATAATKPSIGIDGLAADLFRYQHGFGIDGNIHVNGTSGFADPQFHRLTITYGFLAESNLLDTPTADVHDSFQAFNAAEMASFDKAAAIWGDYANVNFVRVNPDGYVVDGALGPLQGYLDRGLTSVVSADVNLRVGGYTVGEGNAAAFETQIPFGDDLDGFSADIWARLSLPDFAANQLGYGGQATRHFLHEIGHFLGLQHPGDYNAGTGTPASYEADATFREDTNAFTIMSYFLETFGGANYFGTKSSTPLIADISAVDQLYGTNVDGPALFGQTYGFHGTYAPLTITLPTDHLVGAILDLAARLDFSLYAADQLALIDLHQVFQSVGGLLNNLQILGNVVYIAGGAGDDTLVGNDGRITIEGGAGNDSIETGNVLYIYDQNNGIFGDSVHGGDGNDTILAHQGNDTLFGDDGNDTIDGGRGGNVLVGGAGDDLLISSTGGYFGTHPPAWSGYDTLQGGDGNDTLMDSPSSSGNHPELIDLLVQGGAGNDIFYYLGGADTFEGGAGFDTLSFEHLGGAAGAPGIVLDLAHPANNHGFDAGLTWQSIHVDDGSLHPTTLLATPVNEVEAFTGTGGDDTLLAADWAVRLDGDGGHDSIRGGAGNDTLIAGSAGSTLFGGGGSDRLVGGFGSDFLDAGVGMNSETIFGGAGGNDTVVAPYAGMAAAGASDQDAGAHPGTVLDLVDLSADGALLISIDVNLSAHTLLLHGATGDSAVSVIGFQRVFGSALAESYTLANPNLPETIQAGAGDDTVTTSYAPGVALDGGDDLDTLVLNFGSGNVQFDMATGALSGGGAIFPDGSGTATNFENATVAAEDFTLVGTDEANVLLGTAAILYTHGIIHGAGGNDLIFTNGAGSVSAYGDAGDDTIQGLGSGRLLDGGDGNDLLDFSPFNSGGLLVVDLATSLVDYQKPGYGVSSAPTISNFENVTGFAVASASNHLFGTAGANTLTGGLGNDTLDGREGNDTLVGNGGTDSLYGGAGDDVVVVGTAASAAAGTAFGGDGTDLLVLHDAVGDGGAVLNFSLRTNGQQSDFGGLTFSGFEHVDVALKVDLASPIVMQGGALDDTLGGGAGNDTIIGGGGNDVLNGMGGDDEFDVAPSDGADTIDGGNGLDKVVFTNTGNEGVSLDLSGFGFAPPGQNPVQALTLISIEQTVVTLGNGDDTVTGSNATDTIFGNGGNDQLSGGGGSDSLDGGSGDDSITDFGFTGNNTLAGGDGNDTLISGGSGADRLDGGDGNDLLLVLSHLGGPGSGNPDIILGGAGNDTIQSTEPGTFDGGSGTDLFIGPNFGSIAGPINLNLTDSAAVVVLPYGISITGFERFGLTLGSSTDSLTVKYAAHTLDGGFGFDVLNIVLAAGQDIPEPVAGPDSFGGDPTWIFANGMTVTGFEIINYIVPVVPATKGADLIIGTNGHDNLSGGAGNDTLKGFGGDDVLNGGTGADSMVGGLGDDTYVVDNAGDAVVELADQGTDKVNASVSFTLGANVENLTLTGAANLSGTGNALANGITGNAGNNLLAGLGGADTLTGGAGADTLVGGDGVDRLTGGLGADIFRFANAAEGGDRIADFTSGTDALEFSAAGFGGGLVAGMDLGRGDYLVLGSKATQGHAQFIYTAASGALYWDADGTGGGAKALVAMLATHPALLASDLHVIG